MGALVMVHSDDLGLVLPPRIAPTQIMILPVKGKGKDSSQTIGLCEQLKSRIERINWEGAQVTAEIDHRDMQGGNKYWDSVLKGTPLRIEIGPRDVQNGTAALSFRHDLTKTVLDLDEAIHTLPERLSDMQASLLAAAEKRQKDRTIHVSSLNDLADAFPPDKDIYERTAAVR